MLILMFRDVGVFLILEIGIAVGFATALYLDGIMSLGHGSSATMYDPSCPFVPGDFMSYAVTLAEDMLGLGGVGDQIKCSKEQGHGVEVAVLQLYLVVGAILLLNMLIAMMAETFAEVRAMQEVE